MRAVFADTFFYVALASENDQAHEWALATSEDVRAPIVTTAWVLTEVADALSSPEQRPVFLALMRSLETDPNVTILWPEMALFRAGLDLFAKRPDKHWSLTDCISFEAMGRCNITDALTGDRHFEQAGFTILR